jgi:hypothetical protein
MFLSKFVCIVMISNPTKFHLLSVVPSIHKLSFQKESVNIYHIPHCLLLSLFTCHKIAPIEGTHIL